MNASICNLLKGGRLITILSWAAVIWCVVACQPCLASEAGRQTIYYQATYADGRIRNLTNIPSTKEGIVRLVRTSCVEGPPANDVISTGDDWCADVNTNQPRYQDMRWNGKAWVCPTEPKGPSQTTRPASDQDLIRYETDRVTLIVSNLRERLVQCDHAVAEAQRNLEKAGDADSKAAAKEGLAKARQRRQKILDSLKHYSDRIDALGEISPQGKLPEPTGRVRQESSADGAGNSCRAASLVVGDLESSSRQQVWKLAAGSDRRTYRVAMAHARGGQLGAFYYVAYADTSGDGQPDTLIARSPLAMVAKPGQCTSWTFTTDHANVFVGKLWSLADMARLRRCPVVRRPRRNGTAPEVRIYDMIWPMRSGDRKYYINPGAMRVRIEDQNPDKLSGSTGSQIIIK